MRSRHGPHGRSKTYLDWNLPDSAKLPLDQVRQLRDDIDHRVKQLVAELDNARGPGVVAAAGT